jgi:hypothetical protein
MKECEMVISNNNKRKYHAAWHYQNMQLIISREIQPVS